MRNRTTKRILYLVLACLACLSFGCNSVPADMFPKTVGSFRLLEDPKASSDKGRKFYDTKYESLEKKTIYCTGFDASSEEEANAFVKENGNWDEPQRIKPLLDQNGKQIGLKILAPWSTNDAWALRWHYRTRVYRCSTDMDEAEKILEKFDQEWQKQIHE